MPDEIKEPTPDELFDNLTAEPEETPEAPVETPPEPPAPETPPVVDLDKYLLPNSDDLPPSLRNVPVRNLAQDRINTIHQRDNAAARANQLQEENLVLRKAMDLIMRRQTEGPAPVAPKPESVADAIARRADPAAILAAPGDVLAATVETAEERILQQVDQRLQQLEPSLKKLVDTEQARSAISAHQTARQFLNRDPRSWFDDIEHVAFFVNANNLPQDDPRSYIAAANWLDGIRGPRTTAPTPAPVPAAPAPPAGGGGAAAAAHPAPVMSWRREAALSTLQEAYGLSDKDMEEISQAVANEPPQTRSRGKRSAA